MNENFPLAQVVKTCGLGAEGCDCCLSGCVQIHFCSVMLCKSAIIQLGIGIYRDVLEVISCSVLKNTLGNELSSMILSLLL